MLVHHKKRERYRIQLPLTSLIDIVLLLLIYFLLTTNFIVTEGIKVKLPTAKASAPQRQEEITIYVDRDGKAFLDEKEVGLGELYSRLKEIIGTQGSKVIIVRADRRTVLNRVVKVMDVAKAAGAGKLCLATEKE